MCAIVGLASKEWRRQVGWENSKNKTKQQTEKKNWHFNRGCVQIYLWKAYLLKVCSAI
jgi:hypothetical protein